MERENLLEREKELVRQWQIDLTILLFGKIKEKRIPMIIQIVKYFYIQKSEKYRILMQEKYRSMSMLYHLIFRPIPT